MEKMDMFQSLLKWFQTLNLETPHSNAEELSDGIALAQALHQFASEFFTEIWLSKIKTDVGDNWRLKMSNMKKVIEGLYDYYCDALNYSLEAFPKPDAMRIAEVCDKKELERLLQLILGCAVNCCSKQDYIRQIMCLEEDLQANIMQALQELESTWQGTSMPRSTLSIANFDYKMLQEERDQLAQQCFEANKKVSLLLEEKMNLKSEISKFQTEMTQLQATLCIGDDGVSLGPAQVGTARYNDMRKQVDMLKHELLQVETTREDFRLKCQQQEKELQILQQRVEDMNKVNAEIIQLKDEVDSLREVNEKLRVCEAQVISCKKKLEDYNDLKKQLKLLEERSADYIQQNSLFEEDIKKCAALKGQIELYKKEVSEVHAKLEEEMRKNVKIEFENKTMENTINDLQRARDDLLKERDSLREIVDELKCNQTSNNSEGHSISAMTRDFRTTAIIEKLQELELENKALREGQGSQAALMQLLDDANKRNENLRSQLKTANEQIMTLTHPPFSDNSNGSKSNDFNKQIKHLMELNEQKALHLEEALNQNVTLQSKISHLESTLSNREHELLVCDTKFRKCVERSKEIIKSMDCRNTSVDTNHAEQIHVASDDCKKKNLSTMEENLMTTAFYRICVNTQRDAIDSKLAYLLGQGHTFLSRQRQSGPRKPVKGK